MICSEDKKVFSYLHCYTFIQIGTRHIVDATPLEELATEAKLLVTVNKMGKICGIQKSGGGYIEPSLLKEMVQVNNWYFYLLPNYK